jgi:hypothetical protein
VLSISSSSHEEESEDEQSESYLDLNVYLCDLEKDVKREPNIRKFQSAVRERGSSAKDENIVDTLVRRYVRDKRDGKLD